MSKAIHFTIAKKGGKLVIAVEGEGYQDNSCLRDLQRLKERLASHGVVVDIEKQDLKGEAFVEAAGEDVHIEI